MDHVTVRCQCVKRKIELPSSWVRDIELLLVQAVPTLDTLFKKTTTQPKLYWLPLTEAQAAARIAEQAADAGTQLQAGNGPAISAK